MIATVGHVTSEAPGAVLISTSRPPGGQPVRDGHGLLV